MSIAVLDTMRGGLTSVYSRGMESKTIAFGATVGGITSVSGYNFEDYQARYDGELPDSPRYLLIPRTSPAGARLVRVWFKRAPASVEESVTVDLPDGLRPGRELVIPIAGPAASVTSELRLTRFQPGPLVPPGAASDNWTIVALLGNLAKLLWVVGAEHEDLQAQLADVAAQRNAALAHGISLDWLGADLGVPRFPPTAYTFDSDTTIALYHLDDVPAPGQAEVTTVIDDRSRYDSIKSHNGTNVGAHSRGSGRFRYAFDLRDMPSHIEVPDDVDFAVAPNASLTVEGFVRPVPTSTQTGAVIGKKQVHTSAASKGWAFTLGSFQGIAHNLRFSVSDGATQKDLYADMNLADGGFRHFAGVVERLAGALTVLHLHVDGTEVQRVEVPNFGDLTNAEKVLIGLGQESGALPNAQFIGLIDEIRISSVARRAFNPVLGEGDDAYRLRLRVFQEWLLPSPDQLQAAINEVSGPVGGVNDPFVIDETTDPMVTGTVGLRVLPNALGPGQGIAADGDLRATEATASGIVDDESDFDEAWLRRHEDMAGLDFGGVEANRLMQVSVTLALNDLLRRCGAGAAGTGILSVARAYDPAATDLHRVGRALTLGHDMLSASELAVRAHAAGFAFVRNLGTGQVHASQARQDVFEILPPAQGSPQVVDVFEGQDLSLDIDPPITNRPGAEVTWSVNRCGTGNATVTPATATSPAKLHAIAAGDVSVHVEVGRNGHIRGGSRDVRIGLAIAGLGLGNSISGTGERGVTLDAAVGQPDASFEESYLVTRFDDLAGATNVSYGTDPNHRRMCRSAARALDRLLQIPLFPPTLTVLQAYSPLGTALEAQGRVLVLQHSAPSATWLAAAAFWAGFDYVEDLTAAGGGAQPTVKVAVKSAELIEVAALNPDDLTKPQTELRVGGRVVLAVRPQAQPAAMCFSPDGARVFAIDDGDDRITSFQVAASPATAFPALSSLSSVHVAKDPIAVCATPTRVYVACATSNTVSVLDAVTLNDASPAIAPGRNPNSVATDGTTLFVSCLVDRTISAYDLTTNNRLLSQTLPGTDRPLAIVLKPQAAATTFYVIASGNHIYRVTKATLALGPAITTGLGPFSGVITLTGKLYVSCRVDDQANHRGTVHVYDTTTPNDAQSAVVSGFPNYSHPNVLALSADQSLVYVTTLPEAPGPTYGPVRIITVATDTLKTQMFTPGTLSSSIVANPAGVTYQSCIVAVSSDGSTVALGDPSPLSAAPPGSPTVAEMIRLGSGIGDALAWSTTPFSRGQLLLSSSVNPTNQATGVEPGEVLVRAIYVKGNGLRPYQFKVGLRTTAKVRKDQYDRVMNLLNFYHPIGVEVITADLRSSVIELNDPLADPLPEYTFPVYRQTSPISFPLDVAGGGN